MTAPVAAPGPAPSPEPGAAPADGEVESGRKRAEQRSEYIDDDFYAVLRLDTEEWRRPGVAPAPTDTRLRAAVDLVTTEAWLLDEGRFEEWLDLFTAQCAYIVPASSGGDVQREVTLAFDDRRRLTDRVHWYRTVLATAQVPPSRTSHLLSAPVVVASARPGEIKLRSSVVISHLRVGAPQALAGWTGHVLVEEDGHLRIARKLVQLLDADGGHRNLSFLL
jgi:3-phenylpropionate/cinnamic acid dioxygenase small subunit